MNSAVVRPFQPREAPLASEQIVDSRSVYIDRLQCDARIGVYESELGRTQKIELSVWLEVDATLGDANDDLCRVVDYGALRTAVLGIIAERHFGLQETLCEAISRHCLALPEVLAVRVRSGKLEAFEDCAAVGCELQRRRVRM